MSSTTVVWRWSPNARFYDICGIYDIYSNTCEKRARKKGVSVSTTVPTVPPGKDAKILNRAPNAGEGTRHVPRSPDRCHRRERPVDRRDVAPSQILFREPHTPPPGRRFVFRPLIVLGQAHEAPEAAEEVTQKRQGQH